MRDQLKSRDIPDCSFIDSDEWDAMLLNVTVKTIKQDLVQYENYGFMDETTLT